MPIINPTPIDPPTLPYQSVRTILQTQWTNGKRAIRLVYTPYQLLPDGRLDFRAVDERIENYSDASAVTGPRATSLVALCDALDAAVTAYLPGTTQYRLTVLPRTLTPTGTISAANPQTFGCDVMFQPVGGKVQRYPEIFGLLSVSPLPSHLFPLAVAMDAITVALQADVSANPLGG